MSDLPNDDPLALRMGRPDAEFPQHTFPTVFADGVVSFIPAPPLVKFFLHRFDPNMFGRGGSVVNPFAQVVMPINGFLHATMFFQSQLDNMVKNNFITREQLEEARAAAASFYRSSTEASEPKNAG
jgi:hypothetical protein